MTSPSVRTAVWTIVAVLALTLAGMSFASRLPRASADAPWLPDGATLLQDVAYGPDDAHRLDVYRDAATAGPAPVLLLVHGGGWRAGDKATADIVRSKVRHWLPRGFVVVSVNYRLGDDVTPYDEAGDLAAALAHVQRHAAEWGGDPNRVVLMGHSAGANLVAQVTTSPALQAAAGVRPWLGSVALDSAAYDVPRLMAGPHQRAYDDAFGTDDALWRRASPTLNAGGEPPPMLLVCGTWPSSCDQAAGLAAAVTGRGGEATVFRTFLGHGQINERMGAPGALTDAADAFLRRLGLSTTPR